MNRVSLLERQTILELNSVLILGTCLPLKMKFHYYYVLIYIHLSIIAQIWDIIFWQNILKQTFEGGIFARFKLDPKLEKDSFLSDIFDEIQIRTINDSRYIWFILVPAKPQIKEWHDLPLALEAKLLHLTRNLSQFLSQKLPTDKINIAALGNIVSQFHLHIIARHKGDASWPNPVWGDGIATALEKDEFHARQKLISDFHKYLSNVNAQS